MPSMRLSKLITLPLAAVAVLLASAMPAAAAETYTVDGVHSSIVFKVKHLDTGYVWGRFNKLDGKVSMDGSDLKSAEFTVAADSVDTGNPAREKHLKSADFFSVQEFPKITFKSTSIKSAGENKWEVSGDLTLHGKTNPVTVTLEKTGSSTAQGEKIGLATSFTVKRSDFGMKAMPMISDEVELHLGTEMKKG